MIRIGLQVTTTIVHMLYARKNDPTNPHFKQSMDNLSFETVQLFLTEKFLNIQLSVYLTFLNKQYLFLNV